MTELLKNKFVAVLALIIIIGALMLLINPVTASAAELPGEDETEWQDEWYEEYYEEEFLELPDEYYWDTTPAFEEGSNPFTPEGTGTVIDNATDGDGKEFYVIESPDGNIFYLVIDRQRSVDNVYFLGAVTDEDLLPLAKTSDDEVQTAGDIPAIPATAEPYGTVPASEPGTEPTLPQAPAQGNDDIMLYVIIGVAVISIGGAGYYFKIVRPKKDGSGYDDDYGEDFGDDDEDNSSNSGSDDEYEDDDEDYSDENGYEDEDNGDADDGDAAVAAGSHNDSNGGSEPHNSGNSPPYQGNRSSRRRRKKRRTPNFNGQ